MDITDCLVDMLSQKQDKLKQVKQLTNSQLKSWKVRCPTPLVDWPTLPVKVEEEALPLLWHKCIRKNLPRAPEWLDRGQLVRG